MGAADVTAASTLTAIRAARTSGLSAATIRATVRGAHIDAVIEAVTLPITVSDVTITSATKIFTVDGQPWLELGGTGGGISWPIRVNCPAILVDDPAGPWTIWAVRIDGVVARDVVATGTALPVGGELVFSRTFRFAPLAATRDLVGRLRK